MQWIEWCLRGRRHVLEADRPFIEAWAAMLRTTRSKSTVATMLVPVCGFYRWCHLEGHLTADVAAFVRRPTRPRRSNLRWLDADQMRAALDAARNAGPPHDLAIHLLGLNGLRKQETLDARIEHLSTQDGRTTLLLPHRKNDVLDRVSLPAATTALLPGNIRGRARGPLLTLHGHPLTTTQLYRHLDQLSEVAGLDWKLRPHQLRASFVTLALDAGVPARDVMASTGHASVDMVAYYDRAFAAVQRNAAHRLADHLGPQA